MNSSWFLAKLAKMLNIYLSLDQEMQARLAQFNQKTVKITLTSLDKTFYLQIINDKLNLSTDSSIVPDATLSISLTGVLRQTTGQPPAFSKDMEISGNSQLLQEIVNIFRQVEIDWEAFLSGWTGEFLGHELAKGLRSITKISKEWGFTQKLNLQEYLQEEIRLLVHPFAIDDFCRDVENFRDNVERLSVRINLITGEMDEKN